MTAIAFNLKRIVTAFLAVVVFSAPVAAQQTTQTLLEQLQSASPQEAKRIEREIDLEWSKSGSAAMDLLLKRGKDAMREENYAVAIEHFTALTDHAPGFAEGWHARATAYYSKGLYGPALADLQRALALNPDNFNAMFGLGVMLRDFDDLQRAADAFERVLVLHPNHENAKTALEQLGNSGLGREL